MLMRFRIYKEDAMGFRNFIKEDDGVGTVEVVLLLVEKPNAKHRYVLCGN